MIFLRKGFLMDLLLIAALAGCVPSLFYAFVLGYRKFRVRIRSALPDDGLTQIVLFAVAFFCFGSCLFLLFWSFTTQLPYFHREKALIIALLFLLMGILCVQVMQFIRLQNGNQRPSARVSNQIRRNQAKRVIRPYIISNSKT
ncbi:MAG: hypothetical protein DRG59_09975 [Deltaproteobacteria bacterium]|nr:MAG: hypothetical protein DRG59_09975 [Deltaproteobacteria bacterium]